MNKFMGDNFLLSDKCAISLYEDVKNLPIIDYHCHLNPKEIYENRRFENIGSLWLEGDHYKWRLMRAAGLNEELITGSAPFDEKFLAFAKVLPLAAGNPVYHWAHMELSAYFGITDALNEETALDIMIEANNQLKDREVSARSLMRQSNVEVVCTTDDPVDTLNYHLGLANEGFDIKVKPTFRPDKAVGGLLHPSFPEYVKKLTGGSLSFTDWLESLASRLDYFYTVGCRISDLSLPKIPNSIGSFERAKSAFDKAMSDLHDKTQEDDYISYMVRFLAKLYSERSIVMQIHLSAHRNNSTKLFNKSGFDCGNDSVGAPININAFAKLLDVIDIESGLPKLIVYTLNQSNYYEIATLLGCFQGSVRGSAQLGAAWWFCDHYDGIIEQMKVLSATGLLGKFNGMLTDSRSFTSYIRHDYFRRILCSFMGNIVSRGEFDENSAQRLVRAVSYGNAKGYFGIK